MKNNTIKKTIKYLVYATAAAIVAVIAAMPFINNKKKDFSYEVRSVKADVPFVSGGGGGDDDGGDDGGGI